MNRFIYSDLISDYRAVRVPEELKSYIIDGRHNIDAPDTVTLDNGSVIVRHDDGYFVGDDGYWERVYESEHAYFEDEDDSVGEPVGYIKVLNANKIQVFSTKFEHNNHDVLEAK